MVKFFMKFSSIQEAEMKKPAVAGLGQGLVADGSLQHCEVLLALVGCLLG